MTSTDAVDTRGPRVVVMGVAGCGKSTLAGALAAALSLPFLEGDAFHPPGNVDKMTRGIALQDSDREGWLDELGRQLQDRTEGVVLSCSALKRIYRDRLRRAAPGLRFLYLKVSEELAGERVTSRHANHLFPPTLVASQFAALEEPGAEPDALELDGSQAVQALVARAVPWLARKASS